MNYCYWPWTVALLGWDKFNYCCFSDIYDMGKISQYNNEEGVFSVWNNENVKKIRSDIINNQVSEICAKCFYYHLGPDQSIWDRERYYITEIPRLIYLTNIFTPEG